MINPEARVTVNDFMTQNLKLGVGISDWTFSVRDKVGSFAFDPRHSQSFAHNLKTTQVIAHYLSPSYSGPAVKLGDG